MVPCFEQKIRQFNYREKLMGEKKVNVRHIIFRLRKKLMLSHLNQSLPLCFLVDQI